MPQRMRYRLALDLGSTSLGWAMIRLNAENEPCAVIKAGVRIFSDGRNPKDGTSLAVTRREARAMRRRRDRLLKRKARMMQTLIAHGFFPQDEAERKALETLNPYTLRAKGLDAALTPAEFGRALFHINQRRGFKSNRKTDKPDNDGSALKKAISTLRQALLDTGCRTVGEWLHKRDAVGERVAMRHANRFKGNNTPWKAFGENKIQGFDYTAILQRAELMPRQKRARFAEDGMQRWLKDDKGFLARALNDTKYLSKVAREYLSLICPQDTRVIPGQMTAMLRGKFGLNDVLGINGEKNRNDHRHHAVDACVIGVTDQGLLQRFAQANARTRERQLNRLVDEMPPPWGYTMENYRSQVLRAVNHIWVSHKPDHGYEGAMHEDTAWGLRPNGETSRRIRGEDGKRQRETRIRSVIQFSSTSDKYRHGLDEHNQPKPYKGYVGGSNFCMDIVRQENGKWDGEIVSTFAAYQIIRQLGEEPGLAKLRSTSISVSGNPMVMRLQNGDIVKMMVEERLRLMRVVKMGSNGQIFFAEHNEANVNDRNVNKQEAFAYTSKYAGSLQKTQARRVTISPIGELNDPGFKE